MVKNRMPSYSIVPIIRAMATLANAADCAASYMEEQSDAVLMKQLRGAALQSECLLRASKLRLEDINPQWLHAFGFKIATTGGGTEIRLVPLILAPLIKDDTQLYALRDGRAVKGRDIAYDTIVGGCIPYGILTAAERAKTNNDGGNGTEV